MTGYSRLMLLFPAGPSGLNGCAERKIHRSGGGIVCGKSGWSNPAALYSMIKNRCR